MFKKLLKNKTAVFCMALILLLSVMGIFAPLFAPNDPYENDIMNKFASYSLQYPLGTDQFGKMCFFKNDLWNKTYSFPFPCNYAGYYRSWNSYGTSGWIFQRNY